MKLAIETLQRQAEVLRNNIPIQKSEGRLEDAAHGEARLESIEKAIAALQK